MSAPYAPVAPDPATASGPGPGVPGVRVSPVAPSPVAPGLSDPASPAQDLPHSFQQRVNNVDRMLQHALDKLAPHQFYRWLGLAILMSLFILRMILIQGFYIVTYVLLIFILNQFILFLQPKDRASLIAARVAAVNGEEVEAGSSLTRPAAFSESTDTALPTLDAEEFRPFVRRLPEFHFWYSSTVATFFSLWATFFPVFDVPVFWPVLVFYFVLLFVATMRRQWLDMRTLKYVPWDIGSKKTYKSDPKRLSVKPRDPASMARAAVDSTSAAASGALGGPAAPLVPVPTLKRAPGVAARQAAS